MAVLTRRTIVPKKHPKLSFRVAQATMHHPQLPVGLCDGNFVEPFGVEQLPLFTGSHSANLRQERPAGKHAQKMPGRPAAALSSMIMGPCPAAWMSRTTDGVTRISNRATFTSF